MQFVADLHLHSKYSRAVSQQMVLPVMAQYAQQKGLDILSASDFTHPLWFKEISNLLKESGEGIYRIKSEYQNPKFETNTNVQKINEQKQTYFILSTEIASIYKQGEKLRRIHNLVFAPNLETVAKINSELVKRGCNLNADGRPIIGLTSRQLLELILEADERCFLIPCHIWTPHFGLLGSASGFDSIEEAFGDLSSYIYGIETGLSSDPDMNWSIRELQNRSIISCSDAHSPAKMGRESTVFELEGEEPTYSAIKEAIMQPMLKSTTGSTSITSTTGNPHPNPLPKGEGIVEINEGSIGKARGTRDTSDSRGTSHIVYTLEFYPEEGKYHFSGHRVCKVSYGPEEIKEKGTVCPLCRKRMTEGVLLRVQQLSNSEIENRAMIKQNQQGLVWHTDKLHEQPPYVKLVPLLEVIAESMHSTVASQKVVGMYKTLCEKLGSEIEVLLRREIGEIKEIGGERIAEGVRRVRAGELTIAPGYDGEYGKVTIWNEEEDKGDTGAAAVNKKQLDLDFS